MKKITSLFFVFILLFALVGIPVSAETVTAEKAADNSDYAYIGERLKTVEYDGKTFIRCSEGYKFCAAGTDTKGKDLIYPRAIMPYADAENYIDATVTVINGWAMNVEVLYNIGYSRMVTYVDSKHQKVAEDLINGICKYYTIPLGYYGDIFTLDFDEYNNVIAKGKTKTINSLDIDYYYQISATDKEMTLYNKVGYFVFFSGSYYIVDYSEYSPNQFYADGELALDQDITLTLHKIEDEDLCERIVTYMNTPPKEDDLDWIVDNTELPKPIVVILACILFGLLPAFLLFFTIFKLVKKNYTVSKKALYITAVSSLLAIISLIVLIIII